MKGEQEIHRETGKQTRDKEILAGLPRNGETQRGAEPNGYRRISLLATVSYDLKTRKPGGSQASYL